MKTIVLAFAFAAAALVAASSSHSLVAPTAQRPVLVAGNPFPCGLPGWPPCPAKHKAPEPSRDDQKTTPKPDPKPTPKPVETRDFAGSEKV